MSFWLVIALGWTACVLIVAGLLWREARKPLTDDDRFYDAVDRRLDSMQTNGSRAEHPEAALTRPDRRSQCLEESMISGSASRLAPQTNAGNGKDLDDPVGTGIARTDSVVAIHTDMSTNRHMAQ